MTIHLPEDLERGVKARVLRGEFASEDEAIAEAVRLLLERRPIENAPPTRTSLAESRVDQQLLDAGLLSELPETSADYDDPGDALIDITGEPLSETVIRERR
jgi:Arc/MetJ-type ribon-helix-helix transcriptional regulator